VTLVLRLLNWDLVFLGSYCNEDTSIAIIRARCGPHKLIASVLPLVTQIDETDVTVRNLFTGASLIHCYKAITMFQRDQILKNSQ